MEERDESKLKTIMSQENSPSVFPGFCSRGRFRDGTTSDHLGYLPPSLRRSYSFSPDPWEDCCLSFCCGMHTFFGYLFCCGKLRRIKRIEIMLLWLIIITLCTGLGIRLGMFGKSTLPVAATDMRTVTEKVSTVFCDGLTLDSSNGFSAYLFDKEPSIGKDKHQTFKEEQIVFLEEGDYKYWGFYLLKRSNVTVVSCTEDDLELFVIKGHDNLTKWSKRTYCRDCYKAERLFSNNCADHRNDIYTFTVEDSDVYYFAYANRREDTWVTADFRLSRTLYDTSSATSSCKNARSCDFKLTLGSKQVVVYHMGREDGSSGDLALKTICTPRVWVYILIFCSCPVIVGIVCSALIWLSCKEPQSFELVELRSPLHNYNRRVNRSLNERSPLLINPNQRINSIPQQPPEYDDAVQGQQTGPPPYAEATG